MILRLPKRLSLGKSRTAEMAHRVLAIDPGSRAMGFGVVEGDSASGYRPVARGVLRLSGKISFVDRLRRIHLKVEELIGEHAPEAFAIEIAYVGTNPCSALKLGEARAAAILAAARVGLPVFQVNPAEAKKAVTGSGRASKEQVRGMLGHILGIPESVALDASDALAIAMTYLYRRELEGDAVFDARPKRRSRGSRWSSADLTGLGLEVQE